MININAEIMFRWGCHLCSTQKNNEHGYAWTTNIFILNHYTIANTRKHSTCKHLRARSQIWAIHSPPLKSFLQLDDDLSRSVLGSGLGIAATEDTATTHDSTSLVAVSLAKSQASRLGRSGTGNDFLLSRSVSRRVRRRISCLAGGGSARGRCSRGRGSRSGSARG